MFRKCFSVYLKIHLTRMALSSEPLRHTLLPILRDTQRPILGDRTLRDRVLRVLGGGEHSGILIGRVLRDIER